MEQTCLVSKQTLEALMDNFTSLTKTIEDIASSMKTLTKILNKQEVNFKDLATMLDTLNGNIASLGDKLADRMEAALTRLGEQFKNIQLSTSASTSDSSFDIESTIRRRNLLTEKIVRSELLSEYHQQLLDEPTPFAQHNFCRKLSQHLHDCSGLKEPSFYMYPYYVEDRQQRGFIEKRFIARFKTPLEPGWDLMNLDVFEHRN